MVKGVRFELDTSAVRAVGRLRLAAAIVVLIGSIWIVAMGPGLLGWTMVAVAWLSATFWIVAFRRSRREAAGPARHYLDLGDDGLRLAEGGEPRFVPWSEVTRVDVDEERLMVVVERQGAEPLRIEPVYRGAGVHDLAEALSARCATARRGD
jgi:hypothetical protein